MSEQEQPVASPKPRRSVRRWLTAVGAALLIFTGVTAWWLAGQRVWTDDRDIRVAQSDARLRQILWNKPAPVEGPINADAHDYEPALSPDAAELYFVRGKPGAGADVYVSHRRANAWTKPEPLAAINTPADELGPRLSADAQYLFFYSDRPGGQGGYDIWASKRQGETWSTPFNLGPSINGPFNEYSPAPTPDGRKLLFASNRKAAQRLGSKESWRATIREAELGDYDLMVAHVDGDGPSRAERTTTTAPSPNPTFSTATELQGPNSPHHEGACDVSPAGDFIYFASNRPGGHGKFDLYRGRLRDNHVTEVTNLGPPINTPANEADPQLALAGFRILFSSDRKGATAGGYDLFTADSREVFATRDGRSLPALGFSWWLLLASLLLLLPLIWMFRGLDDKKLTLLQRCILLSLLLHVLLGLFFGTVGVTHRIIEFVKSQPGDPMELAVNLDAGREIAIGEAIRNQSTDLPAPAAPTVDASKMRVEIEPTDLPPPSPAPVKVPQARPDPTPLKVQVAAPPPKPLEKTEPLAMTPPPVPPPAPDVKIEPAPAATASEAKPVATAAEVGGLRPQQSDLPKVEATPVKVEALPVRPNTTSLATAAAIPNTVAPLPTETVTPQPAPAPVQPELGTPQPRQTVVTTQPTASPQLARAEPKLSRQATTAPTTSPTKLDLTPPTIAAAQREPLNLTQAPPISIAAPQIPTTEAPPIAAVTNTPAPEITPPKLNLPPVAVAPEERLATAQFPAPSTAMEPPPIQARIAEPAPPIAAAPEKLVTPPAAIEPIQKQSTPLAAASAAPPPMTLQPVQPTTPGPVAALPAPLTGGLGPVGPTGADALMRRAFEQRTPVIEDLGGSKESEQAVARALAYLAKNQEPDGRWTKYMRNRTPGSSDKHDPGLTGLVSLCFLGANHTPAREGPYRRTITRALEYLLEPQGPNGDLRNGGDMYDHALATIALAEAAQMTNDERYKKAALRACDFIVYAQNPSHGGWRYQPRADGDTSVLGWCAMALHSGKALGYEVPERTRRSAIKWLDRVTSGRHDGIAGYTNKKPRKSMTAQALFARILLGDEPSEDLIAEASDYLIDDSPTSAPIDHYTWYYTSLALMQVQNDAWTKWNSQLRDYLVKLQRRSGELEGSWDMDANYGQRAGRAYSTALCTLTLEVYYRYLPMYSKAAPIKE